MQGEFVEGVADVGYEKWGAGTGKGDDVEAVGEVDLVVIEEGVGRAEEGANLLAVDGFFRVLKGAGVAGLYFDEDDEPEFLGDDVDVGVPVLVVGRKDLKAVEDEVGRGEGLAEFTEFVMLCHEWWKERVMRE